MSKFTFIATFVLVLLPSVLFAEGTAQSNGFVPLVGVPFLDNNQASVRLVDYVNAFYIGSISLAAVIAVLRIIFAGVQYMLSDIVTSKGKAKKDIQAALVGLIIIIGAVLVLDTINPSIKMVNPLSLKPLDLPTYTQVNNSGCNITSGCNNIPTCKSDEELTQSFDDSGNITFGCKKNDVPDRNDPPGTQTKSFQYTCFTTEHPNGCLIPSDFYKGQADADCKKLAAEGDAILEDDVSRLGWGTCYYIPTP